MKTVILVLLLLIIFILIYGLFITRHEAESETNAIHHKSDLGERLRLWSIIPFIGILLSQGENYSHRNF